MGIIEKAKELGELIRKSDEMIVLKDCEAKLLGDEKARLLIDDYNLLNKEFSRAAMMKKNEEITKTLEDKIAEKKQQIFNNDTAKAFLDAKANFDKLIQNINSVIIYSITGEEQCSPSRCSTCKTGCMGV